jgi:hypothetical protein
MVHPHSSTASQRAQWVSELGAHEGSYGVVSQMSCPRVAQRGCSWRESAPGPLSFPPRTQSGDGSWLSGFTVGLGLSMHMTREGRPELIFDLSLHFSIADMRTSFYRFGGSL